MHGRQILLFQRPKQFSIGRSTLARPGARALIDARDSDPPGGGVQRQLCGGHSGRDRRGEGPCRTEASRNALARQGAPDRRTRTNTGGSGRGETNSRNPR